MPLPINGYALTWNIRNNSGTVYLHFVNNKQVQVPVDSAQELAALAAILRHSPMISYEPTQEVLLSAIKAPGS